MGFEHVLKRIFPKVFVDGEIGSVNFVKFHLLLPHSVKQAGNFISSLFVVLAEGFVHAL